MKYSIVYFRKSSETLWKLNTTSVLPVSGVELRKSPQMAGTGVAPHHMQECFIVSGHSYLASETSAKSDRVEEV